MTEGSSAPAAAAYVGRGRGMPDAVLSFAASLVLGLVSAVVISHEYGIVVIGEFALVSAPVALVMQCSNLGEQIALMRTLACETPDSERSSAMFLVVLGFSACLTGLVALLSIPVAYLLLTHVAGRGNLVRPAVLLVAAYAVLGNTSWNCDMLQVAFRGTRALLLSRLFDVAGLLLFSVLLGVAFPARTDTLVAAAAVTYALGTVLRVVLLRQVLTSRPSRAALRAGLRELPDLLRFGVRVVPGVLAQGVNLQAGLWIISAVRPIGVLGAYSRANNFANRLSDAGYRLAEVLLPTLSRACQAGDYPTATRTFSGWRRQAALGLALACAPAMGSSQGLLAVFGPGFSQAAVPLGLLLFGYACGVLSTMHGQFLLALSRPGLVSTLTMGRTVLSLLLMAPLTITLGATGAAAALATALLAELCVVVHLTEGQLALVGAANVRFPWLRLLMAIAVSVAAARTVDLLLPGFPGTLAALALGLAAFVAAGLVAGLVRPAELTALRARLPRAKGRPVR